MAGYAVFFAVKTNLFPIPPVAHSISSVLFWVICIAVTMASSKRKIYRSNTVLLFFAGMFTWILWGLFACISRISLASGMQVYTGIITLAVFTHTLFMAVRIVEIYGLRFRIVRLTLFLIAITLALRFVLNFGEFGLSASALSNIFMTDGRTRYGFGFGNVNSLGVVCMHFFIMLVLYGVMTDEDRTLPDHRLIFWAAGLVVAVMLLASASRASMLSLAVFFLVLYSLSVYGRSKLVLRSLMLLSVVLVMAGLPWDEIFDAFWYSRGMNYDRVIPFITQRKAWFAGVGMMTRGGIQAITDTHVMDSAYLYIVLQGGIMGSALFFGTLLAFMLMYFHNAYNMTRLQRCAAGMMISLLVYGLFEGGTFYGHSGLDMINWIVIITCANERLSRPAGQTARASACLNAIKL